MNREEYGNTVLDTVYLLSCVINNTVPESDRIRTMDLPSVYSIAEDHMLTAVVAAALESAGCGDAQSARKIAESVRRAILFDSERTTVLQKLEEAGIWYMPLKGCVLKDCYPKIGMRQMADNDILIDETRANDVRTIMEELGFSTDRDYGRGFHDYYLKSPVCNFEMHRILFADSHEKLEPYYRDIKKCLLKDEGKNFGYHFSNEDFYVYMIAHEYKHYSGSGTGLRSLLDTYVYIRKKGSDLDWSYTNRELEKLGITDFETQNRSLSLHLFGGEALTEADEVMLDYILSSGTYGTIKHSVENQIQKHGRAGFFFYKAFLPYKTMVKQYPVLEKAPFLLPFCWPLRILKALHTKRGIVLYMLRSVFRTEK